MTSMSKKLEIEGLLTLNLVRSDSSSTARSSDINLTNPNPLSPNICTCPETPSSSKPNSSKSTSKSNLLPSESIAPKPKPPSHGDRIKKEIQRKLKFESRQRQQELLEQQKRADEEKQKREARQKAAMDRVTQRLAKGVAPIVPKSPKTIKKEQVLAAKARIAPITEFNRRQWSRQRERAQKNLEESRKTTLKAKKEQEAEEERVRSVSASERRLKRSESKTRTDERLANYVPPLPPYTFSPSSDVREARARSTERVKALEYFVEQTRKLHDLKQVNDGRGSRELNTIPVVRKKNPVVEMARNYVSSREKLNRFNQIKESRGYKDQGVESINQIVDDRQGPVVSKSHVIVPNQSKVLTFDITTSPLNSFISDSEVSGPKTQEASHKLLKDRKSENVQTGCHVDINSENLLNFNKTKDSKRDQATESIDQIVDDRRVSTFTNQALSRSRNQSKVLTFDVTTSPVSSILSSDCEETFETSEIELQNCFDNCKNSAIQTCPELANFKQSKQVNRSKAHAIKSVNQSVDALPVSTSKTHKSVSNQSKVLSFDVTTSPFSSVSSSSNEESLEVIDDGNQQISKDQSLIDSDCCDTLSRSFVGTTHFPEETSHKHMTINSINQISSSVTSLSRDSKFASKPNQDLEPHTKQFSPTKIITPSSFKHSSPIKSAGKKSTRMEAIEVPSKVEEFSISSNVSSNYSPLLVEPSCSIKSAGKKSYSIEPVVVSIKTNFDDFSLDPDLSVVESVKSKKKIRKTKKTTSKYTDPFKLKDTINRKKSKSKTKKNSGKIDTKISKNNKVVESYPPPNPFYPPNDPLDSLLEVINSAEDHQDICEISKAIDDCLVSHEDSSLFYSPSQMGERGNYALNQLLNMENHEQLLNSIQNARAVAEQQSYVPVAPVHVAPAHGHVAPATRGNMHSNSSFPVKEVSFFPENGPNVTLPTHPVARPPSPHEPPKVLCSTDIQTIDSNPNKSSKKKKKSKHFTGDNASFQRKLLAEQAIMEIDHALQSIRTGLTIQSVKPSFIASKSTVKPRSEISSALSLENIAFVEPRTSYLDQSCSSLDDSACFSSSIASSLNVPEQSSMYSSFDSSPAFSYIDNLDVKLSLVNSSVSLYSQTTLLSPLEDSFDDKNAELIEFQLEKEEKEEKQPYDTPFERQIDQQIPTKVEQKLSEHDYEEFCESSSKENIEEDKDSSFELREEMEEGEPVLIKKEDKVLSWPKFGHVTSSSTLGSTPSDLPIDIINEEIPSVISEDCSFTGLPIVEETITTSEVLVGSNLIEESEKIPTKISPNRDASPSQNLHSFKSNQNQLEYSFTSELLSESDLSVSNYSRLSFKMEEEKEEEKEREDENIEENEEEDSKITSSNQIFDKSIASSPSISEAISEAISDDSLATDTPDVPPQPPTVDPPSPINQSIDDVIESDYNQNDYSSGFSIDLVEEELSSKEISNDETIKNNLIDDVSYQNQVISSDLGSSSLAHLQSNLIDGIGDASLHDKSRDHNSSMTETPASNTSVSFLDEENEDEESDFSFKLDEENEDEESDFSFKLDEEPVIREDVLMNQVETKEVEQPITTTCNEPLIEEIGNNYSEDFNSTEASFIDGNEAEEVKDDSIDIDFEEQISEQSNSELDFSLIYIKEEANKQGGEELSDLQEELINENDKVEEIKGLKAERGEEINELKEEKEEEEEINELKEEKEEEINELRESTLDFQVDGSSIPSSLVKEPYIHHQTSLDASSDTSLLEEISISEDDISFENLQSHLLINSPDSIENFNLISQPEEITSNTFDQGDKSTEIPSEDHNCDSDMSSEQVTTNHDMISQIAFPHQEDVSPTHSLSSVISNDIEEDAYGVFLLHSACDELLKTLVYSAIEDVHFVEDFVEPEEHRDASLDTVMTFLETLPSPSLLPLEYSVKDRGSALLRSVVSSCADPDLVSQQFLSLLYQYEHNKVCSTTIDRITSDLFDFEVEECARLLLKSVS
ncbi:hypothetical protein RCL1_004035 [Eukaryota sp. TZLM3-RCL]